MVTAVVVVASAVAVVSVIAVFFAATQRLARGGRLLRCAATLARATSVARSYQRQRGEEDPDEAAVPHDPQHAGTPRARPVYSGRRNSVTGAV